MKLDLDDWTIQNISILLKRNTRMPFLRIFWYQTTLVHAFLINLITHADRKYIALTARFISIIHQVVSITYQTSWKYIIIVPKTKWYNIYLYFLTTLYPSFQYSGGKKLFEKGHRALTLEFRANIHLYIGCVFSSYWNICFFELFNRRRQLYTWTAWIIKLA